MMKDQKVEVVQLETLRHAEVLEGLGVFLIGHTSSCKLMVQGVFFKEEIYDSYDSMCCLCFSVCWFFLIEW